ncbi:MAG: TonB-dependent receptor plug domain-containing protein [Pseudomonadales bacterium]|nr:TonB-dependent receptor plug domain-containing protein [Pseudomonadales bacterium]
MSNPICDHRPAPFYPVILIFILCVHPFTVNALDLFDLSLEELLNLKVTTASRYEQSSNKAPATMMVVTQQQIRERGYRHLLDLLQDMPSIDVQLRTKSNSDSAITIRGVTGNNKFIIMQDGVRISSPTGESMAIHDNFPLFQVKQVEIVYGPASSLYGADAFTAVINLITYNGHKKPGSEVAVRVGEDNERYAHFQWRNSLGENIGLSIGGHLQSSDNQDLSAEYPERYQLEDLTLAFLNPFASEIIVPAEQRPAYDNPSQSHSINLRFDVAEQFTAGFTRSNFVQATSQAVLPDTVNYGQNANWETTVNSFYLKYHMEFNDTLSSSIQVSWLDYEVDESSKYNNVFSAYENAYKYARGSETELTQ